MFSLGATENDLGAGLEDGLGAGLLGGLTGLAGGLLNGLLSGGSTNSNVNGNVNENQAGGGLGINFAPVDINNSQKGGFSLFGGGGGTNSNANNNVNQNAAQANNSLSINTPFQFPNSLGYTGPQAGQTQAPQLSTAGLTPPGRVPVNTANPILNALAGQRQGGTSLFPFPGAPPQQQQGAPAQMQPGLQDTIASALKQQSGQAAPYMPSAGPLGSAAPSVTAQTPQSTNPPLQQWQMEARTAGQPQALGGQLPPPPPGFVPPPDPGVPTFTPSASQQAAAQPAPDPSDPEALQNDNAAQAALIGPQADKILTGVAEAKESLRERLDEKYAPLVKEARAAKREADRQARTVRQAILETKTPAQQYADWQKAYGEALNEIAPLGSPEQQLHDWYRNEINKPGWADAMRSIPQRSPVQELGRRLLMASGRGYARPVETAQQQLAKEQALERYKQAISAGAKLSDMIQKRAESLNTKDYDKEMTLKERTAKEAQAEADKVVKDLGDQYEKALKNGQLEIHREARNQLQALKAKIAAGQATETVRSHKANETQRATNEGEVVRSHKANEGFKARQVKTSETKEERISEHQKETTPIWKRLSEAKAAETEAKTAKIKAGKATTSGPPGAKTTYDPEKMSKARELIASMKGQPREKIAAALVNAGLAR